MGKSTQIADYTAISADANEREAVSIIGISSFAIIPTQTDDGTHRFTKLYRYG
jgi:hypothetical protein